MGSNLSKEVLNERDLGVIPKSMKYLFNSMKNCEEYEFVTTISLIEIYNEEIIDLLNYKNSSKNFTLREDKSGQVFISGLTESVINDSDDALQ